MYIEGCHRLPLDRNATNTVTVKFVNRKNSKAILQEKKSSILKVKLLQPIVCILTKVIIRESVRSSDEKKTPTFVNLLYLPYCF